MAARVVTAVTEGQLQILEILLRLAAVLGKAHLAVMAAVELTLVEVAVEVMLLVLVVAEVVAEAVE
jgi:hypothetical protein